MNREHYSPMIEVAEARGARRTMGLRLTMWSGGSWLLGLALWLMSGWLDPGSVRSFLEAFGSELIAWGLLCVGIGMALLSQYQRLMRERVSDPAMIAALIDRELPARDRLLRVLRLSWILLAVLFVPAAVVLLVIGVARHAPSAIGHGTGVMIQSAFLMLFDRAFSGSLQQTRR